MSTKCPMIECPPRRGNSSPPMSMNDHPPNQQDDGKDDGTYWIGQVLKWDASPLPVTLYVELPFWLMVDDTSLHVEVNGHDFRVDIREGYYELHVLEVLDSRQSCVYIGPPDDDRVHPEIHQLVRKNNARFITRKCKTVLQILSQCNGDVLAAEVDGGPRSRQAIYYLQAYCSAHLEVVNRVLQAYRLATYDFFPYEVSPWDVPIWLVKSRGLAAYVPLVPYAIWDHKPHGLTRDPSATERYQLIDPRDLAACLQHPSSPGEFELLDAMNLMERGDYSGAVRRVTTAIEVLVEVVSQVPKVL